MSTKLDSKKVLIFGGTGAIGSELVRLFTAQSCDVVFTYKDSQEKAQYLQTEFKARGHRIELENPELVIDLYKTLDESHFIPDVLVYAAVQTHQATVLETTSSQWQNLEAVNCESAFKAAQEMLRRLKVSSNKQPAKQILFLSALDRQQHLPLPAAFAATQGKLATLASAMAKEVGAMNVCVNMLALGPLEKGLAEKIPATLIEQFKSLSALGRLGTPTEAAQSIFWMAMNNTYMTGKSFSINGGI